MAYELLYSEVAEQDLARLPPHLLNFVERQLLRLAEDPVGLGRPGRPPYPSDQVFLFGWSLDEGGEEERFSVHFRYGQGQDENKLQIIAIGHYTAGY